MQAHQLTLFVDGYFTSPWDAICFVALTEKQLEFTTARAVLRDGQALPAPLRAQTAIARIPALRHGEFWLTESLAIVEYLEEAFPPPGFARLLPVEPEARARVRQIMAWLRFDLRALRLERPWQLSIYPPRPEDIAPLSPEAERGVAELLDLVNRLSARGEFADWNIAHADLVFALWRISRLGHAMPPAAHQLIERHAARPSVRAYLEHARPPNPPPRVLLS